MFRRQYSLKILWHERSRFLPAVLAVACSVLLIAIQVGVLLGSLAVTAKPIDHADAEIWVGIREVPSIELGHPVPESWLMRLEAQPEVSEAESYLYNFGDWKKPAGGSVNCIIIGTRLESDSLGALRDIGPETRMRLTEPGSVVVDETELTRLGIPGGVGSTAEVMGQRVRIVGLVKGFKSIWGPYVFCSQRTARKLLPWYGPRQTQYLLARCQKDADPAAVVKRLRREQPTMAAFTREEFSLRTQLYWLTQTRAGISMGFTVALALLVGLVITSQTLYAATAASLREYAVLRALGIPRWRMSSLVMVQSFWIGMSGLCIALPGVYLLGGFADRIGAEVLLPTWLLFSTAALTLAIALFSGLLALRSLRFAEPATLLR